VGRTGMIILDTHVLLWLDQGSTELGIQARDLADCALTQGELIVSAITFWETALLAERGRITLPSSIETWRVELLERGLQEVPVNGEIAITSTQLQNFHADPADRMITATAIFHHAILLTADRLILQWDNALKRHDARK
jgi:PIN domain nuclease of toxin-antitoxin system